MVEAVKDLIGLRISPGHFKRIIEHDENGDYKQVNDPSNELVA